MAGYGFSYRSVSTYSTTRTGSRDAADIKPFAPFVPKSNGSNYSEGAVTKKIIVPVTSRRHAEPSTEKYASSGDESDDDDESDDEFHHQTIPVHTSPRKVVDKFPANVQQNHEGGRIPQRLGPIVDRGRHSPQPTAEGRKPVGISPIKNDKYHGSGDHPAAVVEDPNLRKEGRKPVVVEDPNLRKEGRKPVVVEDPNLRKEGRKPVVVEDPNLRKEGRKPIVGDSSLRSAHDGYDNNGYGSDKRHKPVENSIKNGNYDSPNRYGGDHRAAVAGDPNPYKEQRKPMGTGSIRSASRDGYNNGYGGGDKEGRRPIEGNIKNGNYEYDSPNRYGGDHRGAPAVGDPSLYKEGHKPIGGGSIRTNHDGYNSGYSGDKEGYKPVGGGNIQNDYYGSPNGYGGDYKEGHKPIGGGNIQNGYYDSPNGYGEWYKPVTNGNYGNSYGNAPKISSDWSAAPRKGIQLSEPTHDIDKALELLMIEAEKHDHSQRNNDHHHYYDSPSPTPDNWGGSPRFTDRTGSAGIMRPSGNVNQLQSRPRNSPIHVTFVDDGRDYGDDGYYRRGDIGRYGYRDAVMDSREAEKKFKGTRV